MLLGFTSLKSLLAFLLTFLKWLGIIFGAEPAQQAIAVLGRSFLISN